MGCVDAPGREKLVTKVGNKRLRNKDWEKRHRKLGGAVKERDLDRGGIKPTAPKGKRFRRYMPMALRERSSLRDS